MGHLLDFTYGMDEQTVRGLCFLAGELAATALVVLGMVVKGLSR